MINSQYFTSQNFLLHARKHHATPDKERKASKKKSRAWGHNTGSVVHDPCSSSLLQLPTIEGDVLAVPKWSSAPARVEPSPSIGRKRGPTCDCLVERGVSRGIPVAVDAVDAVAAAAAAAVVDRAGAAAVVARVVDVAVAVAAVVAAAAAAAAAAAFRVVSPTGAVSYTHLTLPTTPYV